MKRTFIDANLILDLLLHRGNYELVISNLKHVDRTYFISALTVHLVYHFSQKEGLSRELTYETIDLFEVLPLNGKMVKLAQQRYRGKDFEDCLQAACAELGDCDEILTADRNFAKDSGTQLKVRVIGQPR